MLFPSRTTLFVFVSTLLFCATAVERIQSLLRMTCVVCGKYTNNCANLEYESISKGLFFLFHLFSRPKLDFLQEWDRFHLPSTTPLLRIHEKRLLWVAHSPRHRVVWKIHCLISNLVVLVMNSIPARILSLKRTEGSLSSMKPRLTTTSNAILSLNLIAIILWGIAHPFHSPFSYSSLFCFYKHVDTFYIGLEENMHKMIELNAISSLSCFFSLFL